MIWNKKEIDPEIVRAMAKQYGCPPLVASILLRRGIADGAAAFFYLEKELRYVHNPFLFADMEDAVDRILDAKEEGERVLIFGDRDVDGITAVTILYEALTDLGIETSWRIPTGDDPYGLTCVAVDAHEAQGGTLIITVDCGISNREEVAYAAQKGIDVIIIDHHTPQETVPDAAVIINPKMPDCGYPNSHLSGCAVAWKVITALRFGMRDLYKQEMCLLNVRPVNDAFAVEAIRTVNLTETARISETLIPGMVSFSDTRLASFLQGQQIFVWDKDLQLRQLEKIFGKAVEFYVTDFRQECAKSAPQLTDLSLLRIKSLSRAGKYADTPLSEIDGFFNLFITVIQQTYQLYGERELQELQLVALSLLADLMQLDGENRILVKQGLAAINAAPRPGLSELMSKQGLISKQVGTGDIAWNITPVINAAGRMGKPETALRLFLEKDKIARAELAETVVKMNEERKELGKIGWSVAEPIARESLEAYGKKLTVVVSKDIHRGITGILSSKLAGAFNVPSMVMCLMDGGTAVGSLRSARNYRVLSLLESYPEFFIDYGGHNFAAGFSLMQENIEPFLEKLRYYAATIEFDPDSETPAISVDAELPHKYLTPDLLTVLDTFEPYGEGFPVLHFAAKNMKIAAANIMGKTLPQHLKLTLDCGLHKWTALYWQAAEKLNTEFSVGDSIDAVFTISRNTFNGNTVPQMVIQDMQKTVRS
ncbi:MAG: single-stranded-DNA-specific exonuclease RecJ [Treponema sp.]